MTDNATEIVRHIIISLDLNITVYLKLLWGIGYLH